MREPAGQATGFSHALFTVMPVPAHATSSRCPTSNQVVPASSQATPVRPGRMEDGAGAGAMAAASGRIVS